jgi:FkbH-like protein
MEPPPQALIKCLVWDLDDTLWQGTLLEGDEVVLRPGVKEVIRQLDDRGIMQSIASKNDFEAAWRQLTAFELDEYFLHPQIGWNHKSDSIRTVADSLGVGLAAIALIDDQPFERDEVRHFLPEVTTLDALDSARLLDLPALQPRFVTGEARLRRKMYQADIRRKQAEQSFAGSKQEFLATIGMCMTIRRARERDLERARELTVRANQLNTNGRAYCHGELLALLRSRDHILLVAELEDRYGSSGLIGLALIEQRPNSRVLKLFIMSCRVISRGTGAIMLSYILQRARRDGVRLRAEFVANERNRPMYITYRFNGFFEVGSRDGAILLEHALEAIRPVPPHVTVRLPDEQAEAAPAGAASSTLESGL